MSDAASPTAYADASYVVEFADVGAFEQCPWKRLGFWTREQADKHWPELQAWVAREQPSGFFRLVYIRVDPREYKCPSCGNVELRTEEGHCQKCPGFGSTWMHLKAEDG